MNELLRLVRFIDTESSVVVVRGLGGKNGEFLFHGHRVAVSQEEK